MHWILLYLTLNLTNSLASVLMKYIIYKSNTTYQTYAASFKISPISPTSILATKETLYDIYLFMYRKTDVQRIMLINAKQLITNNWYKIHNNGQPFSIMMKTTNSAVKLNGRFQTTVDPDM